MTKNRGLRTLVVGLTTLFVSAIVGAGASPALADGGPPTYNNAEVNIAGGNAHALSACVLFAKEKAKKGHPAQSNACKNFAKATGGTVSLKNVDITILQAGAGGPTYNRAKVDISGGDATAVAACVSYLQGTNDADQTNRCKNSAVATGGDVKLKDVSITIIQG